MSRIQQGPQAMETLDPSMIFDMDFGPINPAFAEPLTFDGLVDDALFNDNLTFDTSPPERLYSTPLSWEPPRHQIVDHKHTQPVSRTTGMPLTAEQQEKLRSIAMPEHLRYHRAPELHDSMYTMASTPHKRRVGKKSSVRSSTSVSSPDQNTGSRKRKCTSEAEDDEDEEETEAQPHKKTAHNMIEKRYRMNLNDKFTMLRDSVPSLRAMSRREGRSTNGDDEDLYGLIPAHKKNKATVLEKATEYIKHLEKLHKNLQRENAEKDARIQAFEKLYYSGAMGIDPTPVANTYNYSPMDINNVSSVGQPPPQPRGLIEVPDDIRRMNAQTMQQNQEMYTSQDRYISVPQHANTTQGNRWVRGYLPKMMVGSLATILVIDGFSAEEQNGDEPAARGLSAFPVQIIHTIESFVKNNNAMNFMGSNVVTNHASLGLKLFLLLTAIVYVILPLFFQSHPSRKAKAPKIPMAAPSLASSIQVRRQAWLTAIQTVWVPRHNFFLEVSALLIKMCKLSLRNLVGPPMYALLTGVTQEQEEGRIKAWNIALDAQLGGGDVEISKSRLTLTLLASGTLPDTPARLMMKALHIRVLLWELANAGYGNIFLFHEIAAKLARTQWNKARQLESILPNLQPDRQGNESLSPHLASLLQCESDDVLDDVIGQRAHNLAWNKPTMFNAMQSDEMVDDVVTDFAIRSPLDAVAAWFSTTTLHNALFESLSSTSSSGTIASQLELAISTAPDGSAAHARALVARALLVDEQRGASIAAAMLDVQAGSHFDGIGETSLLVDSRLSPVTIPQLKFSLACATAIAHISRGTAKDDTVSSFFNKFRLPAPSQLSFLAFVAAYHLMQKFAGDEKLRVQHSSTLERLAGRLRVWSGGVQGRETGLTGEVLDTVTSTCLRVIKESAAGWRDEGYGSVTGEDDLGC